MADLIKLELSDEEVEMIKNHPEYVYDIEGTDISFRLIWDEESEVMDLVVVDEDE